MPLSEQRWSRDEMVWFFHDKVLCGIGQDAFKIHMQRVYSKAKDHADRKNLAEEFVSTIIYHFGISFQKRTTWAPKKVHSTDPDLHTDHPAR